MAIKIAVAQCNLVVGDLAGNARRIVEAARAAHAQGVRLLLTPELAICAYPAEDLWLRPAFVAACEEAVQWVAAQTADLHGLHLVVGQPLPAPAVADAPLRSRARPPCFNGASVIHAGAITHRYAKRELPNYQVFDERRYFVPGDAPCVFEIGRGGERLRVGLLICEDAWTAPAAADTVAAGAQVLCVINASPFHVGKGSEREQVMRARVQETGCPLIYAHLVGGQDELVFEGRSFALDARGQLCARSPGFVEDLLILELSPGAGGIDVRGPLAPLASDEADLWHALVLGTRDYVQKNGFPGAIVGLSGGIDSALVLALAVDALGPQRVRAVMMPSPYTAEISRQDAAELARRLGVRLDEIPIGPLFSAYLGTLQALFEGRDADTTEENLQARIRGTLLMALSNKFGSIVLTTGNKSEMATGYCTLYGDMAGGFAVIKDVSKTWVWRLARWRNANDPYGHGAAPIPERIITRPPSAELRPDQTDQDTLPPYEVLDAIVERYMENDRSAAEIIAEGYPAAAVEQVVRLIHANEYKRRQAPVGLRVTHRSFGKDWRYPNTNRWRGV
jgi:NAD+ synthase (glutamine-hydrolysing)